MLVRFWGTRGSLPTALGQKSVRMKIRDALIAAQGRKLDTAEAVDAFIDHELPFSVRGTFGGNTSCVERVTGGEAFMLCDLGSGVREFGSRVLAEAGVEEEVLTVDIDIALVAKTREEFPVLRDRKLGLPARA